jgi:para-aminobenzoate synthetase
MNADLLELFPTVAARQRRMFWIDRAASQHWSPTRSILGWLNEDDVSLTYHAAQREVRRHRGGTSLVVGEDIFTSLEQHIAAFADTVPIWVGYFGYACRPDLPANLDSSTAAAPDAVWMACRNSIMVDHATVSREERPLRDVAADLPVPASYARQFAQVQRELRAGNSYEVNLTYREQCTSGIGPAQCYLRLRRRNPAPYAGYLRHGDDYLLSSSPERFAAIDEHRSMETRPIKGTTPRDPNVGADEENRAALAADSRYRSENLMIVDLLRSDMARVCRPGTVTVPQLMAVESYPAVHQLVSTVRGQLCDHVTTMQALRCLFPAGSMTGAPKQRTMQIIADTEATARGPYAGAFGWISANGQADLGVVIRSLVATRSGAGAFRYQWGTGGGITVRSDVLSEYHETRWKAEVLRQACTGRPPGATAQAI